MARYRSNLGGQLINNNHMNKKLLVLLLVFSLSLAGCQKVEEDNEDNNDNNGAISVQPTDKEGMPENEEKNDDVMEEKIVADVEENTGINTTTTIVPEPKPNPNLCENDMDCVAIPHPSNACYKAYYNKNNTVAIDAYRARDEVMVQDCPEFGPPVCMNNVCTEKK